MGAPGNAFLCKNGHIVHWIDEHMMWDKSLHDRYETYKAARCPRCNEPVETTLNHYGDINDCLDDDQKLTFDRVADTWTRVVKNPPRINLAVTGAPLIIWPWDDTPKSVKNLIGNQDDIDYVAYIPPARSEDYFGFLDSLGPCDVKTILLKDGSKLVIGYHA